MQFYPEDLNEADRVHTLRVRSALGGPSYLGLGGCFGGMAAGAILSMAQHMTQLPFSIAMEAGLTIFAGFGAGALLDNKAKANRRNSPLTSIEIQSLGENREAMTRDYYRVLNTLLALPPQDALTTRNIRNTVRCLGEAIERLPANPPVEILADPNPLRAQAAQMAQHAMAEADSVVAASLERQAEALTRRAETLARTEALARRHQTLREEVAAQIRTFQTSLAAAQIHGTHGSSDFVALAESVAQVAQEANALADARTELEAALEPPRRAASLADEAVPLRNGVR